MAKKDKHVSETPATQMLRRAGVEYTEHPYDYVEHGGTAESARQLGVSEHEVVKTLVMQDDKAQLGAWVTVVQGVIFVICVLAFRRGIIGELGNWLKKPL